VRRIKLSITVSRQLEFESHVTVRHAVDGLFTIIQTREVTESIESSGLPEEIMKRINGLTSYENYSLPPTLKS
jgi:hypothetical protein